LVLLFPHLDILMVLNVKAVFRVTLLWYVDLTIFILFRKLELKSQRRFKLQL